MKKLFSILFLFAMLVQAVPVLHFFSEKPEVFFAIVDEEKPSEKNKEIKEEKQGDKSFLSYSVAANFGISSNANFKNYLFQLPHSPYLETLTPPPDVC